MTTVDLTLQDSTGGELHLCAHDLEAKGYVVVKTRGTLASLNLAPNGAEELVRWLTETFDLTQELEAVEANAANFLRIVVPGAAGGEPREVSWSGDDDPPEWFERLAYTALTGVTRRSIQESLETVRRAATAGSPESMRQLLAVRQTLARYGINVPGGEVDQGMEQLAGLIEHVNRNLVAIQDALLAAGFQPERDVLDIIRSLVAFEREVRQAVRAEQGPQGAVLAQVRALYLMAREPRGETHPADRRTVRDLMAHLGIDQGHGQAHEALVQRVSNLLADVDRATERAAAAEAEVARLQESALVAKLAAAREGLEYARLQFIDPETGGPAAADWTDEVSSAIVDRLDEHIGASDPEA